MKQEKLPVEFKEAWCTALRSGEYKKGKSSLKSKENKWCCLGVACDIVGIKVPFNKEFIISSDLKGIRKVPKLLHGDDDLPLKLANMNDGDWSFKRIATWIEKNL